MLPWETQSDQYVACLKTKKRNEIQKTNVDLSRDKSSNVTVKKVSALQFHNLIFSNFNCFVQFSLHFISYSFKQRYVYWESEYKRKRSSLLGSIILHTISFVPAPWWEDETKVLHGLNPTLSTKEPMWQKLGPWAI